MKFLLFTCLLLTAFADKIEIYNNGNPDVSDYQRILHPTEATPIVVNVDHYGEGFKKKKGFLKLFHRSVQLDSDVRKIVLMNIPNHFYRDYHVAKLPKDKMVLFMWEPLIRQRKMYNPKLHACFSKIYTWDDDLVDNQRYFKFYYPVLQPMVEEVVPFEDKKFCTLVSGNIPNLEKYLQKYPQELYSERLKAIEFFERVGEEGFEFYGRGWDNTCRSYRGACSDKIGTLKNYRFSICYENCRDVNGYITEKIFDCFAASNVPIYWGAANITDYIPKDCFIDRRDFATLDDLYVFLKTMSKEDYEGYLKRIRAYLKTDKAHLFSKENYEKIFLEAMNLPLKS